MSLPTVVYNGTAPDGGDIGMPGSVKLLMCRNFQYQSMVHNGGCSVGSSFHGPGLAHDSRSGVFLFWVGSTEIRVVLDLVVTHVNIRRIIPGTHHSYGPYQRLTLG